MHSEAPSSWANWLLSGPVPVAPLPGCQDGADTKAPSAINLKSAKASSFIVVCI